MIVVADSILRHWFASLTFRSKGMKACLLVAMLFLGKSEGFFHLGILEI